MASINELLSTGLHTLSKGRVKQPRNKTIRWSNVNVRANRSDQLQSLIVGGVKVGTAERRVAAEADLGNLPSVHQARLSLGMLAVCSSHWYLGRHVVGGSRIVGRMRKGGSKRTQKDQPQSSDLARSLWATKLVPLHGQLPGPRWLCLLMHPHLWAIIVSYSLLPLTSLPLCDSCGGAIATVQRRGARGTINSSWFACQFLSISIKCPMSQKPLSVPGTPGTAGYLGSWSRSEVTREAQVSLKGSSQYPLSC